MKIKIYNAPKNRDNICAKKKPLTPYFGTKRKAKMAVHPVKTIQEIA